MDVNIYQGQQLVHSSIASRYIRLQRAGQILDDKQNQKIKKLSQERDYLAFPVPRLPHSYVDVIDNSQLKEFMNNYINSLPSHIVPPNPTQNIEDQPFYQSLDSNTIPLVRDTFPDFIQLFYQLIQILQKNIESFILKDFIVLFRFLVQLPYIPPYSIELKPIFKTVRFSQNVELVKALQRLFKIEVIQNILSSSVTRRWSKDIFSILVEHQHDDDPKVEKPTESELNQLKSKSLLDYQDYIDVSFSHFFSFVKLLYNTEVLSESHCALFLTVACGSRAYQLKEIEHFVFKNESVISWLMYQGRTQQNVKLFAALAEKGFFGKILSFFKYYKLMDEISLKQQGNIVDMLEIGCYILRNSKKLEIQQNMRREIVELLDSLQIKCHQMTVSKSSFSNFQKELARVASKVRK